MADPTKKAHPLTLLAGIVGAIGGWTVSHYCGASIWIPGAAMLLLIFLFSKTPIHPKYFGGAIAATGGHIVWFVVGAILSGIPNAWSIIGLDVIVLALGIVWLWVQPGLVAALFLGLVELISLGMNALSLNASPFGSAGHRALTAHCVVRVIVMAGLVAGIIRFRREQTTPPAFSGASTL